LEQSTKQFFVEAMPYALDRKQKNMKNCKTFDKEEQGKEFSNELSTVEPYIYVGSIKLIIFIN